MSKKSLKRFLKSHLSKAQSLSIETLDPSKYCIIDIRKKSIFHSTAHFKGALNISDFDALVSFCRQNPSQKILLMCNGGLKASQYGERLVELGLKNIYFLDEHLYTIQEYFPLQEEELSR